MKTTIKALIFLFFLGIAFGEQHCIDDSFGSGIVITNTYSGVEYYKVSYAATPGAVLSLSEPLGDGFFLMPGEQKIIDYSIRLPFPGNYSLSFTIVDSKAKTEVRTSNYEVYDCHSVDAKITSTDTNYCLRQVFPYKVLINNTGKYEENLSVMINSDPFNLNLMPGEAKEYDLEFYPSSLNENKVIVSVSGANITSIAEKSFNLRNCDTTAVIVENLKACPGQAVSSTISLSNLGFSQDAYQVINSSSNIIINPAVFTVGAKEEAVIPFMLMPGCGEIGLKSGEVNIYSLNSGLIKVKISYEALNCFDFEIIESNTFSGYCEGDSNAANFTIKNKGLMADSYMGILKYGDEEKTINLYLEPKESATINITEYFNYSGNSKAELAVLSNNFCEKTESFIEEFVVEKYSECYNAKLEVQEYFRGYSRVRITNNGSKNNTYTLSVFNSSEISNMSFSLMPKQSRDYQLNNLDDIMKDYGISVFSVNLKGLGVDLTEETSYSASITGMVILAAKEYYSYVGLVFLATLIALFAKNNVLKQRKSNIKA